MRKWEIETKFKMIFMNQATTFWYCEKNTKVMQNGRRKKETAKIDRYEVKFTDFFPRLLLFLFILRITQPIVRQQRVVTVKL